MMYQRSQALMLCAFTGTVFVYGWVRGYGIRSRPGKGFGRTGFSMLQPQTPKTASATVSFSTSTARAQEKQVIKDDEDDDITDATELE